MIRRIWAFFRVPSTRWGTGILMGVGGLAALLLWGAFSTALHRTSSTEFCVSCHEMGDTVFQEYKKTVHYQNKVGVRAGCADCHVPDALGPKLLAKVKAGKDVWGHFTGVIDTKEKFENHRLTMAKSVWQYMQDTDSRECRSCHSFEAMTIDAQKAEARAQHPTAIKAGETCISCHKGIAHTLPDMTGGYKLMYSELEAKAASEGAKADVLYPIKAVTLYPGKEMGKMAGTILPAAKLTVIERSGDALKVRLSGWQQDGAASALYTLSGKRIFTAVLTREMVEQVRVLNTRTDPNTDLVWHQVELDAWVKKEFLTASLDQIWNYGSEMYAAQCNTCHKAPTPDHNLANQWIGILESMKRFMTTDKDEYRFMLIYLQMHAGDIAATAH